MQLMYLRSPITSDNPRNGLLRWGHSDQGSYSCLLQEFLGLGHRLPVELRPRQM